MGFFDEGKNMLKRFCKFNVVFFLFSILCLPLVAFSENVSTVTTTSDQNTVNKDPVSNQNQILQKKKNIELVLVLDKSGSMNGLEKDTIGGFNSMLETQKKSGIPVKVTAVLFSDKVTTLVDHRDIKDVPPLTDKDYIPGGMTALLDAVGTTITKVGAYPNIDDSDNQVIFVVITDGLENSSVEYKKSQLKKIISDHQEKKNWKFVFLGANIDAVSEAESIGINGNNALKYQNSGSAVRANFKAVSELSVSAAKGVDSNSWKDAVEEDTNKK